MLADLFPEHIESQKLFIKNAVLSGVITLNRLPRFSEYIYLDNEDNEDNEIGGQKNAEGRVEATLSFLKNDEGYQELKGTVSAKVRVQCQRCLTDTPLEYEAKISVIVVANEKKGRLLPKELEWVSVENEELDVLALIEDELILSLPIVAYHEDESCNQTLSSLKKMADQNLISESVNPFASLEGLRQKLQKPE